MSSDSAARAATGPRVGKYTFHTSAEYYVTLRKKIEATKPGDRIVLVTLWLRTEMAVVAEIVDALEAAGKRGVHVTLLIDAFHFLIKQGATPGPAYFFGPAMNKVPKRFIKRRRSIERLEAAGVHCQIINQTTRPFAHPFKGRSHIKYSVINDEVFIGGCNLSEAYFLDVMVSWQDKQIADWLCELGAGIVKSGRVSTALANKDLEVTIDKTTSLLIDSGTPDQSILMDRAHDIIDQANKELLITYQYFPFGPTAERLAKAVKRGVSLRVFYNHPSHHQAPLSWIYAFGAQRERAKGPVEFMNHRLPKNHTYLHAKVLTNESVGLLSSHNYMVTGVTLGTAEIGMMSTDPGFVRKLNETLLRQLDQSAI